MNRIMEGIKQNLSYINRKGSNNITARFLFSENFIGFNGHFPGKPVLPGFCKIQAVLLILQEVHKKKVILKEIIMAKFFSPVSWGEELIFECKESNTENDITEVHANISSKGKKIAKLHLKVTFEPLNPELNKVNINNR